jgi:hypothetical protein
MEPLKFEIQILAIQNIRDVIFGVGIAQPEDNRLASIETTKPVGIEAGRAVTLQVRLDEPRLAPGIYYLIAGVRSGLHDLDYLGNAVQFEVSPFRGAGKREIYDGRAGFGPICCAANWQITNS